MLNAALMDGAQLWTSDTNSGACSRSFVESPAHGSSSASVSLSSGSHPLHQRAQKGRLPLSALGSPSLSLPEQGKLLRRAAQSDASAAVRQGGSGRAQLNILFARALSDAGRTRYAIMAYPSDAIALPCKLVAVGLTLHPSRPALTELAGLNPPTPRVP
jgi:hypothetical protein